MNFPLFNNIQQVKRSQGEEINQKTSDAQKGALMAKLRLIVTISAVIQESSKTEIALQRSLKAVCAYTGWLAGHIYLGGNATELVSTDIWNFLNYEKLLFFRRQALTGQFVPPPSVVDRVLLARQVLWTSASLAGKNEEAIKIAIYVPIVGKNSAIGLMEFFSDKPIEEISSSMANTLILVGMQIGEFFEDREMKNRQEQGVEEIKELNINLDRAQKALLNILEDTKGLERSLREHGEYLNAVIGSMAEGLLVIDTKLRILTANQTAEKILGISRDIADQNVTAVLKFFKAGKEFLASEYPFIKTLRTGETQIIGIDENVYCRTLSGGNFPIGAIITPLKGNGVTGAVIIFKNLTKEKQLDETKNSFIAIASHQLRTPLTTMRWYVEMLEAGDAGDLNKMQKEFVEEVQSGVMLLTDTLNMLLTLARVESGQLKKEAIKVNLIILTRKIIEKLESLSKAKKTEIKIIADEKNLPEAETDPSITSQVIMNLLANSFRYTDENGKIEIKIEKQPAEIVYSVKDDGIGIPDEVKPKIFERFFRAENASKKVPDGSGLGIHLAKNLVEMWGGKIWFESPAVWTGRGGREEKKGTIFYFTIPVV